MGLEFLLFTGGVELGIYIRRKGMKNQIIAADCLEVMRKLPSHHIDITVTSPPYNVGKEYSNHDDKQTPEVYFSWLKACYTELYRITKKGGRFCLNVPFIGNSYFCKKSTHLQFYPSPFIEFCQDIGWVFRDFVVWVKTRVPECPDNFCGNATSWGSWKSPSNPFMRCFAEIILVFYKEVPNLQHKGETDLTKEAFLTYTKNIWYFPAETSRKHPAPFPEELPKRCIQLYSYKGDLVFDPMCGSGTTCVVAKRLERQYVGIDISEKYCGIARHKLDDLNGLWGVLKKAK